MNYMAKLYKSVAAAYNNEWCDMRIFTTFRKAQAWCEHEIETNEELATIYDIYII